MDYQDLQPIYLVIFLMTSVSINSLSVYLSIYLSSIGHLTLLIIRTISVKTETLFLFSSLSELLETVLGT